MARWTAIERCAAVVAAFAALGATPARGGDAALAFRRHGQPVAEQSLAALKSVSPARSVRVFEPYEQREVAFTALPFASVLDAVYGPGWRDEEEILFTCRDGYQPTVPLAREREGADFAIDKLESGRVQHVALAPFYLIWENTADAALRAEGDYGWPYQLTGVDLIRSRDRFPRMAPPASAPAAVQKGFAAFRIHCSRCHAVNGEGGKIGPELNRAESAAGRRDAKWLHDWIDDPTRISPNTRMERLNPALADRDAAIASIIAYLQAIAEQPVRDGG